MKSKKSGVLILSALTLLIISTVLIRVCAQPEIYWKASYTDYAPSGMPDFDQKQWGAYNWTTFGTWSHCGPVAVANSLWWYDSAYEISTTPPPAIIDNFNLVTSYNPGGWDDHDPLNVQPFVEHLAHLMDTDGRRTGLLRLGTNVTDMETGVAQYLSWSGVNPQGDVDGNGIVDATDLTIVNMAMGSSPGTPGWNMAADIWPATSGWPVPGVSDNLIDGNDLNLVTTNMNRTGMFYEHTVPTPDFYLIEEEVERCQDVVLILGFYTEVGPGEYFREDYPYPYGHAVTVAGVNSTTMQIAISDPIIDAFEMGLAPGRSPVLHMHMPPEPPYITHNDASLVSHDVYNVTFDVVTGMWKLKGYAGLPTPPFHVLIESAVITSSESTPPNIVVLSPENKTYSVDSIPLNFTVDETPSWMGYSRDGQANATITGNTTLSSLLDGSHYVVVYANDTAGNMGTSNTVHFTVDTMPPSIEVLSPENKTYAIDSVPLNFTVDEASSWMGYSRDGQANATITGNTTLAGLLEGGHYAVVYANDTLGNMGASGTVYFTVDTTPPNITDVSQIPLENNVQSEDEVRVNATVIDVTGGVERVALNYTNGNGTWVIIEMTSLSVQKNVWSAIIPSFPYGTNVTYGIIAEDNMNNTITTEDLGYEHQYTVIPEFPSLIFLPLFMIVTLLKVIFYRRKCSRQS